jgi:beta-glucan synthesis-associated protein KRE6
LDVQYITWINNGKPAWTLKAPGMAADTRVEISARPIPQEPMVSIRASGNPQILPITYHIFQYIIANLGMSTNFGDVDLEHLTFPAIMRIDYIRVYQPKNAINIGCDPDDFPTAAYINQYVVLFLNCWIY